MSANQRLLERSLAAVWHPCTQMQHHLDGDGTPLIPIARGQGPWLYDFDGKRYLDGVSSWWVNLFGHANPRINAALKAQLDTLEHVILAGFTHEPVVELSERLAALTGGRLGHCSYGSDGASATEIALKMSHHYWRNTGHPEKDRYLCLENSYHGETVGALAVTDVSLFKEAYAPLVRPAGTVPSPDWRRAEAGETAADVARRAAAALEARLEKEHAQLAALIVEPLIQCAGGMAMHDPLYLKLARELCDRYGVHLICDEIAVGNGRTGTYFAHQQADIVPDFLCTSKGLTGGYLPLSVVLTTDKVYEAFLDEKVSRAFLHSHSYTGNALACRAALATLDIFKEDRVLERNREKSARFDALLAPLKHHPQVRHYRHRGMIFAFDVADAPADFSRRFYKACLAREILLRPFGNTVYFMPPYVVEEAELAFLSERAAAALDEALS